jgi:hypothetical protein
MKNKFIVFVLVLVGTFFIQNTANAQVDSLLMELESGTQQEVELLPKHMIFTQRMFWGKKGLLRLTKIAPLTEKGRATELKIRRTMLVSHQILGYATLGGMVAQGVVGAMLYNGKYNLRPLHEGLGVGVNAAYFTTAGLSLLAPPPLMNRRSKKMSSIKMHKILATIHLSSMIITNVLAGQLEDHYKLRPYHRAAAYTAFGSFALAMVVMKF